MARLNHRLSGVASILTAVLLIALLALSTTVNGFSLSGNSLSSSFSQFHPNRATLRPTKGSNLYMGRHAVVRALTKARTDGAKSKNNSR